MASIDASSTFLEGYTFKNINVFRILSARTKEEEEEGKSFRKFRILQKNLRESFSSDKTPYAKQ